jgi:hypothetical protein
VEPDQLIATARQMIKDGLKPVAPWDEKGFKAPGGGIWTPASAQLWPAAPAILRRETAGNYPAALAILKCVYEGLQVPFDTALKIEQRYFTEVLQTTEAFSMIRSLFISTQELGKGARRPAGVPRAELTKVGVVGAGFMGASIAYVTAAAGIPVTLIDRDMETASKGKTVSEKLVKDSTAKGRFTQEEGAALLSRIETGERALALALDYVAAIKKTPIVVNDTRGFFVNRCVLRYMSEAYDMLIEGIPPAMIENVAKMAGMPVGPLALNDEVAIDLSLKILKATVADLGDKGRRSTAHGVDLSHGGKGRPAWPQER